MSRSFNLLVLAGLLIGLIINSIYIVNEKEKAIVFQFGEAVNPNVSVGIHFKLPVIQNVKKFDARLQTLDEEADRILTVESCLLYTSPSPRDRTRSRMPSSA